MNKSQALQALEKDLQDLALQLDVRGKELDKKETELITREERAKQNEATHADVLKILREEKMAVTREQEALRTQQESIVKEREVFKTKSEKLRQIEKDHSDLLNGIQELVNDIDVISSSSSYASASESTRQSDLSLRTLSSPTFFKQHAANHPNLETPTVTLDVK